MHVEMLKCLYSRRRKYNIAGCLAAIPSHLGDSISKTNKCLYEIFDCYMWSKVAFLSITHNFESHSTNHLDFTLRKNSQREAVGVPHKVPECLWTHKELAAFKRDGLGV